MKRVRTGGYGLSRELWLVQVGIFVNALGWGAVLPFEIYYLHTGRGFSLSLSGFIVATLTGVAVVAAPLVGTAIDRLGARTVAALGGLALGVGYAGLAIAHGAGLAFAAAVVAGLGNGALLPAQSTLIASLATPEIRHRATAVSRVCTNAGFGLGSGLGGFVAAHGLSGLVALMLANAVSYVIYVAVLVAIVKSPPRPAHDGGGYRELLRDRPFARLAWTNIVVIAVGWGVFSWIVPLYARSDLAVSSRLVGLPLLANAFTVVLVQVPVARLAEGRSRARMMAAGAALFAAAFLLVIAARPFDGASYAALLVAAVAIGVGECFHTAALMPLVADLAPSNLRGRYMATIGLSWWTGLAVGPFVGTQLLRVSSSAMFATCATAAAAAAASLLALDRRLPAGARLTPRSHRTRSSYHPSGGCGTGVPEKS